MALKGTNTHNENLSMLGCFVRAYIKYCFIIPSLRVSGTQSSNLTTKVDLLVMMLNAYTRVEKKKKTSEFSAVTVHRKIPV